MEGETDILRATLILLATSVITVATFRRLALPPVLAYLLVGAAVGPFGFAWIQNTEDTRFLAEFGVVFLLFTVGLEFSLPYLVAMRRVVLGVGAAQVIVTVGVGAMGARLMGLPPEAAVIIGGVLAMSSTAVVTRELTERLELSAPHGRNAVGVLLFQDMAVLPFLVAIPVLAGAGSGMDISGALAFTLFKAALVVAAMLFIGYWLLRPAMHLIAASRSAELFTLTALLFALTAAAVTQTAGLSLAIGGFLAGMMLGETEFRHQIEADIRPFRDVLLGLFFITIGMELDVARLPALAPAVVLLLAAILLFKTISITLIGRLAGNPLVTAARTGIVLAQGGEFGFAIISVALGFGLLPLPVTQTLLATIILSMAITPFLVANNERIVQLLLGKKAGADQRDTAKSVADSARFLQEHVIICGYGRIGQSVARFVELEGLQYLALDLDPVRVRDARAGGEPVNFGDATHREILAAAGLDRARALVIAFDNVEAALKIIEQVRTANRELPILVRSRDDQAYERLDRAGATEVVPETLEASLMLASHLLLLLDIPPERITRHIQQVRAARYEMLHAFFHGQDEVAEQEGGAFRERLHTVLLPSGAKAVNHRLKDAGLRELGVVVTAVRRGGIRGEQPQPEMILRAGDALVLYGAPEKLQRAEARLLRG
jgi:CPA2 family monovalent cation:H+ antiporter-2